jgi:hypothetical protein
VDIQRQDEAVTIVEGLSNVAGAATGISDAPRTRSHCPQHQAEAQIQGPAT